MRHGIKEKDIRDFEKYANKLNGVMERIRKYNPKANAFLRGESGAELCLFGVSEEYWRDLESTEAPDLIVTSVTMEGFDGGAF